MLGRSYGLRRAFDRGLQFRQAITRRTLVTTHYSEAHEAIQYDDTTGLGTVCITNYAQTSLGDCVFVELPQIGSQVVKDETIGTVESVKAASDVFSPVSGVVESINEALREQPGLVNKSPEGDGWLCKIRISNREELSHLLDAESYKKYCEQ